MKNRITLLYDSDAMPNTTLVAEGDSSPLADMHLLLVGVVALIKLIENEEIMEMGGQSLIEEAVTHLREMHNEPNEEKPTIQ